MNSPAAQQRVKLGFTQQQMAVLLKTVQSEISKTENGVPPAQSDLGRWARAYRVSVKKFVRMVQAMQWELPLWRFGEAKTPAEIQHIDCTRKEIRSA